MQHIGIICVGKLSEAFYAAGTAEYEKRLTPLCRFDVTEIAPEPINEKNRSDAVVQAALKKEGEKILAAVPAGARMVALCVEGKQISSEDLCTYLQDAAMLAKGGVVFVIGSSHGLWDEVKKSAHMRLSLSRLTFPHQMARLLVTEQVYRAFQIARNSRYHK